MSSLNKAIIMGRLGKDPELKTVGQGTSVARLSIALSEKWVDKNGQKHERVDWLSVVVWGKQAENCAKYLSKGRQALVEGKIQVRSYEDKKTQEKKYVTEIIAQKVTFIDSQKSEDGGRSNKSQSQETSQEPDFNPEENFGDFGPTDGDGGDIPF